jgi:SnoaL-like polyketide cyclase.
MTYLERIQKMYGMIGQGQSMEALEEFYHEDVEVIEATGEVRKGKAVQRESLKGWFDSISEMHGGGTGKITANEADGITMVESWIDATFKNGNRWKLEEVGVQHWQDGKIIKERFYYNAPNMS